jgi:hypothetical protein
MSIDKTFFPNAAKHADRLIDVVVFPTPPFWLATAIILPILYNPFYYLRSATQNPADFSFTGIRPIKTTKVQYIFASKTYCLLLFLHCSLLT